MVSFARGTDESTRSPDNVARLSHHLVARAQRLPHPRVRPVAADEVLGANILLPAPPVHVAGEHSFGVVVGEVAPVHPVRQVAQPLGRRRLALAQVPQRHLDWVHFVVVDTVAVAVVSLIGPRDGGFIDAQRLGHYFTVDAYRPRRAPDSLGEEGLRAALVQHALDEARQAGRRVDDAAVASKHPVLVGVPKRQLCAAPSAQHRRGSSNRHTRKAIRLLPHLFPNAEAVENLHRAYLESAER